MLRRTPSGYVKDAIHQVRFVVGFDKEAKAPITEDGVLVWGSTNERLSASDFWVNYTRSACVTLLASV